ncbi:MAG: YqgE/AlgH family protein [Alphaproteobacteria bacterium]|nr:YqgE/AlgH family protein [Alphaproteobacteria bacterium]
MTGSLSPAAGLVGRFLVAAPSMPDERFRKSVILLCQHDEDGALGLIVNNSVDDLALAQVFKQLGIEGARAESDRPVLFGGPVQTERGMVLHSEEYRRDGTLPVAGGLALTASLEVLRDMADGRGPARAWLALGHAGWGSGQLERELQDNAWLVVDGDPELVFDGDLDGKWQRALDRLGGGGPERRSFDPALYSHQSGRA